MVTGSTRSTISRWATIRVDQKMVAITRLMSTWKMVRLRIRGALSRPRKPISRWCSRMASVIAPALAMGRISPLTKADTRPRSSETTRASASVCSAKPMAAWWRVPYSSDSRVDWLMGRRTPNWVSRLPSSSTAPSWPGEFGSKMLRMSGMLGRALSW